MATKKTRQRSSSTKIPQRWLDDFALIPGYDPVATARKDDYFNVEDADFAVGFYEHCLTHIEGKMYGKPYILEPHERAIIGGVWGWKNKKGLRRYRKLFYYVPRKNSKTTLLAGLVSLFGHTEKEYGMQLCSAAADSEQAAIVYQIASSQNRAKKALLKRCKIYDSKTNRVIYFLKRNCRYRVLSSDAKTKHGGNANLVIVDELHAQANTELIDTLETSMGAREQPLMAYATTADFDRPSPCNEMYDHACRVRDGKSIDPTFFPVIYEASVDDDWTDPEVWERANPMYNKVVGKEYYESACSVAKEMPSKANVFKRLYLNIKTQQDILWLPIAAWDACKQDIANINLKDCPCYAGLDVATKYDINALSLVFEVDGKYLVKPYFWIPRVAAVKYESEKGLPFTKWEKDGLIKVVDGERMDANVIEEDIKQISNDYSIDECAFDPWNANQMAGNLDMYGLSMIEFPQNIRNFNEPTKEFESIVNGKNLIHDGNPILRWMAGNVQILEDNNSNIRPVKPKSGDHRKIDGIVATVMGLARHMTNKHEPDHDNAVPIFI